MIVEEPRGATHLVVVSVDVVQLMLLRAARASKLLRLLDFVEDAEKLDEAGDLLREEIERNRRQKAMSNWIIRMGALAMVLLLIGISAPSVAQDGAEATAIPDGTPVVVTAPETLVIPAWLVVVIGGVAVAAVVACFALLWRALAALEKSNPPETVREIRAGIGETIEKSFAAFGRLAKDSTTPFDDLIAEIGEPGIRRLIAWLKAMPNEQIANSGPLPPEVGTRRDISPER